MGKKVKINLAELARMITTAGWLCEETINDKPNPLGDFTVTIEGMRKFVDSWRYSPDKDCVEIPMTYFAKNEVEKGHLKAMLTNTLKE